MSKEATHKVVITATSSEDSPEVNLHIEYGPINPEVVDTRDYKPAAYEFIERALTTAAELADEFVTINQYEARSVN